MKEQGVTEDRLQLLRGVTGAFRPGVLTALMGVSGAGKTILMDVLAGRKTGGYIEGDIRISGFPKKQETFARISGYCEQNDIHSPQVTVRESLIYSAFLRLPKEVNDEEKMVRLLLLQSCLSLPLSLLQNSTKYAINIVLARHGKVKFNIINENVSGDVSLWLIRVLLLVLPLYLSIKLTLKELYYRFSPLGEWSGRKLRYIRIRFRGCLSCNYTFHCIYLVFIVGSDHLIHQSLYSK